MQLPQDTLIALLEPEQPEGQPSELQQILAARFEHVQRFDDPAACLRELPATEHVVFLIDRSTLEQSELLWLILLAESKRGTLILMDDGPLTEVLERAGVDLVVPRQALEQGAGLFESFFAVARAHAEASGARTKAETQSEELREREAEQRKQTAALRVETEHFVRDSLHEFRTPLTSMHEFASILHDGLGGPLTEKQQEYLEYVLSGTRDMLELFDDFRDSIRLRLDDLPTMLGTHEMRDIVEAALAEAKTERVTYEVEMPHHGGSLFADAGQLRTSLARVLSYSAKCTPRGGRVKLRIRSSEEDGFVFSVVDGGPKPTEGDERLLREGSTANHLQRKSVTKVFGIGIELARALIQLNGGQLELTSEAEAEGDGGSVLTFRVPKCKPARAGRPTAPAAA